MTREEAIRILDGLKPNTAIAYGNETAYSIGQALTMAIKALEQEPSGDLISRQAVIDIVDSYSESQSNVEDVTQDIISDIMVLSSVNPQEPKTGHWVKYDKEYFTTKRLTPVTHSIRECSECHTEIADFCGEMRFCPNCGCRMVESQESEVQE